MVPGPDGWPEADQTFRRFRPAPRSGIGSDQQRLIPGDTTDLNDQETNRTFWRQTIIALVQRAASALANWLSPAHVSMITLRPDLDQIEALSFDSVETANDWMNRTLESKMAQVDKVAAGASSEETLVCRIGTRTGKEAWRAEPADEPVIRDTYGVVIVLRRDTRMSNGYRVHTAYPFYRNAN